MAAGNVFHSHISRDPGRRRNRVRGESNLLFVSRDPTLDIYAVADRLEECGWLRGRMREPKAIQQGVNPAHLASVEEYLSAVRERSELYVITLARRLITTSIAIEGHPLRWRSSCVGDDLRITGANRTVGPCPPSPPRRQLAVGEPLVAASANAFRLREFASHG